MKDTAIFVDGANLSTCAATLGFKIDFKRLLQSFGGDKLFRAYYFTAIPPRNVEARIHKLVDWLGYNGYNVVTKQMKEFTNEGGFVKIKGNMDVEMTIAGMRLPEYIDNIILFSGDGDFRALVEVWQQDASVTVVSSKNCSNPMCADELRRQADKFIDLAEPASQDLIRQMDVVPNSIVHPTQFAARFRGR